MPEHYFDSKLSSEEFEAIGSVKKRVKEMIRRFCARIGRSVAAEKSKVITMSEPTVLSESILSKTTTKSPTTEILPTSAKKLITKYGEVEKNEVREMFPHSPEIINTTEYLGGSSGVRAGYFNGELFVVKKAREFVIEESGSEGFNRDQLIDEYIADKIYQTMGFSVPVSKIYEKGKYKVSRFIPGKDLNTYSKNDPELKQYKEELQKGFGLDCLLANWDVIGAAGGDNIRFGDDGKVYRIDNGGSLRFRAKGARKGSYFGKKVSEIRSMRDKNELFADISDDEVKRQINEILENQEKIFNAIDVAAKDIGLPIEDFQELRSILKERIEYLKVFREGEKKEKKTDKGIYESITTNNYFEGWPEIELEGNPEIKDTIRENIMRSEVNNQYYYQQVADELKISVEEFKKRLQEKVEDMVGQAEFFRATQPGILEQIMNVDGRWKSQFETGTSQGTLSSHYRGEQEEKMFGFLDEFGKYKERRPIYGYFSDDEHGGINNSTGKIPPPTLVNRYGSINIKIKRDRALEKATITFHDSLSPASDWPPTPATRPHFTSVSYPHHRDILDRLKQPSIVNWGSSYTEVQYHGQLTVDDVESIHVSRANGVFPEEIEEVRKIFNKYKLQHPESTIKLIEF